VAIEQLRDRVVVRQFVAYLAVNGHPGLLIDRIPEDEGGSGPPIDAVAGSFAIEHTSMDTVTKGQDWTQIKSSLREWVLNQSPVLPEGAHRIQGVAGIPFDFSASKSTKLRPLFLLHRSSPADNSLPQRLRKQLDRKAQKLAPFRTAGHTTVLLVESGDIALMNQLLLVGAIRTAFRGQLPQGIDRVWYADTNIPTDLEFHDISADITR
jgi:hypothetical protein